MAHPTGRGVTPRAVAADATQIPVTPASKPTSRHPGAASASAAPAVRVAVRHARAAAGRKAGHARAGSPQTASPSRTRLDLEAHLSVPGLTPDGALLLRLRAEHQRLTAEVATRREAASRLLERVQTHPDAAPGAARSQLPALADGEEARGTTATCTRARWLRLCNDLRAAEASLVTLMADHAALTAQVADEALLARERDLRSRCQLAERRITEMSREVEFNRREVERRQSAAVRALGDQHILAERCRELEQAVAEARRVWASARAAAAADADSPADSTASWEREVHRNRRLKAALRALRDGHAAATPPPSLTPALPSLPQPAPRPPGAPSIDSDSAEDVVATVEQLRVREAALRRSVERLASRATQQAQHAAGELRGVRREQAAVQQRMRELEDEARGLQQEAAVVGPAVKELRRLAEEREAKRAAAKMRAQAAALAAIDAAEPKQPEVEVSGDVAQHDDVGAGGAPLPIASKADDPIDAADDHVQGSEGEGDGVWITDVAQGE